MALARLSDGSVGRALDLAAGGGVELYGEMIALLADLPRLDITRLYAFSDRVAKGPEVAGATLGGELYCWWLARQLHACARGRTPSDVVPGEGALTERLLQNGASLELWSGLWEKSSRLLADAARANLDHGQAMTSALLDLQSRTAAAAAT